MQCAIAMERDPLHSETKHKCATILDIRAVSPPSDQQGTRVTGCYSKRLPYYAVNVADNVAQYHWHS